MPAKNALAPIPERHQLQQLIGGLGEGIIVLEPDGRIGWANAAALAMHEVRSIKALGADIDAYFQTFDLRHMNDRKLRKSDYPMSRAKAADLVEPTQFKLFRHGAAKDEMPIGIHAIRTLTLVDPEGRPDFHAIVHADVTVQVEAEERFERTFASNPAPAMIVRHDDHRIIKVNPGFLQMTGYTNQELVNRTLKTIDLFDDKSMLDTVMTHLAQADGFPQTDTTLRVSGGARKFVILAGQPLQMGEAQCILLTYVDVDARRKAEHALKHNEELFSKAFRLAPVPMLVVTRKDARILDANDAFLSSTHYKNEEALGYTLRELSLWRQGTTLRDLEQAMARQQSLRGLDARTTTKDGEEIDGVLSAEAVMINDDECMLIAIQDITDRKRTETELITAIEAVMQDTSWFSRSIIEKLANIRNPGKPRVGETGVGDLTSREQDVLGGLCQGLTDAEIASSLGIARNTVRNHVSTLYEKIGVNRRSGAIVWARERGFTGARPRRPRD
ncbi:helix-turn-helix transcriptional regulator [Alcaligenaceae bacterium B3P038]|nr:helix-turn-helix transcriptional regulator [Alcaligenaceae bacterium B3P038]